MYELRFNERVFVEGGVNLNRLHESTDRSLPIKQGWRPVNVVEYLVAKSGITSFTSDRRVIHETFLHLQHNHDLEPFLAQFTFSEKVDPFPFSRLLESVLGSLQLGNVIAVKNFQLGFFEVNRDLASEILNEACKIFDHQELIILNRGARKLPEMLQLVKLDIQKHDESASNTIRLIQANN